MIWTAVITGCVDFYYQAGFMIWTAVITGCADFYYQAGFMIWAAVNTGCADFLLLGRLYDMDRCDYRVC